MPSLAYHAPASVDEAVALLSGTPGAKPLAGGTDLIVQMNKTDISFGEMFSGTTSQQIVDISNVPVLTVNPMKRESMPLSY